MPTIQNKRALTFCGAWTAYGFHEDGFSSGIRIAANYLDARPPFVIKDAERIIPSSFSDSILDLALSGLELIRRMMEAPFVLMMMILVGIISVWENILELMSGGTEKPGTSGERLEVVRAVRRNWQASAGISDAGAGKRVKFA
jgi:hypothetical protein